MANNYTQFANGFEGLTPDEITWWKAQLDGALLQLSTLPVENQQEFATEWDQYCKECNYPTIKPDEMVLAAHYKEWGSIPFAFTIEVDAIGLYAEECGDIEVVADLAQAFLKQFNHDDIWHLTWANTCSKPRWGEFNGGAVIVTAESIEFFSADQWVYETIHKIKAARLPDIAKVIQQEDQPPTDGDTGLFKTTFKVEVLSNEACSHMGIAEVIREGQIGDFSMHHTVEHVDTLSRSQMAIELEHQGSDASFLLGDDGWKYAIKAGDEVKWVDPDGGEVREMKIVSIHIKEQGGEPGDDIAVIEWTTLDGSTGGNLECLLEELT